MAMAQVMLVEGEPYLDGDIRPNPTVSNLSRHTDTTCSMLVTLSELLKKGQLFYLILPSQLLSFRKFCPTPIEMFINNKGSSEVPREPDHTSWIMEQQVLQNLLMPPQFNWSCQTMAHPLLSCGSCGFWVG